MASVSLFNLSAGTTLASGDVLVFCDISDTTQSANGSDLKITLTNFFAGIPVPVNVTSASASALAVGRLGATTPAFTVDASTASQVAGLKVTGAATGGTVAVVATDSGAATNLTINAKGSGTIGIGTVSTGLTTIGSALAVSGAATLASTLGVTGASTLAAVSATTGAFSGAVTAATTLGVTGATTLAALSATTGAFSGAVTAATTLGVTGATTLAALSATTGAFSGAVTAATTLGVTGATTLAALSATTGSFSSTLGVTGAATLSSTLTIGGLTYTFPASQTANRFLKTDGSGTLSWATILETIALTDLSDVTITSQATGQILRASSASAWANSTATFPDTATAGHLLYASASNVWSGLTIGAANTVLLSTGSAPSWVAQSTLTAPAGLLTGTTLASNVVTSSLTAIGTLASGAVPASLVTAGTFGSGSYTFPGALTLSDTSAALTLGSSAGSPNIKHGGTAGRLILDGDSGGNGGAILLYGSTHSSFASQIIYNANTHTWKTVGGITQLTLTSSAATFSGALAITGALTGVTTLTTSGAINGQTISSAASLTGTLAVAGVTTFSGNVFTGTGTGAILFRTSGGALSGPALAFVGDDDTGLWRSDAGTLQLVSDSVATLTLTSAAATFSGTLAVAGAVSMTGNVGELSLGNTTSGSYSHASLYTGSAHISWRLAAQDHVNNGFEITPSTANGGTTFSTPVFTITSAGAARMSGYGAGAATFDASGNITSVSDERQKTDIVPFIGGLAELRGIVPIAHKFSLESGLDTEHTYIGFSAQNVREHLPGVVFEHAETGTLSLWDRGILAATVNAVKSLDERVSALEVA